MTGAELWDLTDEDGTRTGEVVRRGAASWPTGRFHVVVATCVVRADGRVLMTRRAAGRDFPLAWEFPGGSALAGETSRQAAAREVTEETGLAVSEPVFALVGRFTEATALVYLYVALVPGVPELVVDPVEVHEAEWVTVGEAEERFAAGEMAAPWVDRLAALWPDARNAVLSAVRD
ncbi:NUDIX domain-containing protein [Cellulomonas humilata]|uniref:Isopentenyl-diphosphate delta-isomerase n=1 Tax=Cellulomonas humilata TaxID=144055 RepID=A0ABU0EJT7_9CELL|nr:NUDIX domain-containing protein [Cellulomonas humilata]MDQ0375551.1 isopentenyl-diphosphate delta-isomerase [Cellulomonas humilata]